MRIKSCFTLLLISVLAELAIAQIALKPSIGISSLPSDSEAICKESYYTGHFDTSGLQVGDTAFDFKLYELNGDSSMLGEALKSKAVLLISGSYTCPVFRKNIPGINDLVNNYGNQLEIWIVYTLEAHPHIDSSVYFGMVNTTSANFSDSILYRNPLDYAERKAIVSEMLNNESISAKVLIDGPCNNWWKVYGPAPNNATLIDTNGVVFAKHDWYNRYPHDIKCDIDSLLGLQSNCKSNFSGQFDYWAISTDTVYLEYGANITFSGEVSNNGMNPVLIDVVRSVNDLPQFWVSSLCLDVCYQPDVDTVQILLDSNSVLPFSFYFYTNETSGLGRAQVKFRNTNDFSNNFVQNLVGDNSEFMTVRQNKESDQIAIYPNPTEGIFMIHFTEEQPEIRLSLQDSKGSWIGEERYSNHFQIETSINGPSGIYFIKIQTEDGVWVERVVKE